MHFGSRFVVLCAFRRRIPSLAALLLLAESQRRGSIGVMGVSFVFLYAIGIAIANARDILGKLADTTAKCDKTYASST